MADYLRNRLSVFVDSGQRVDNCLSFCDGRESVVGTEIQCYRLKYPFPAMLGRLAAMISDFKNPIFNRDYGTRIFRRRIRIEKHGRSIVAGLEDTLHAFKLVVQHDGDVVTAIEGTWLRYPNGTCPGAVGQFAPYIGKALTAQRTVFRSYSDSRQQCSHFLDVLGLVFSHALREEDLRQFDVTVPDIVDGRTWAEIHVNGEQLHRWQIDSERVLNPAPLNGRSLYAGFGRWSAEMFEDGSLEAAHVLQMAILVSFSGMLDFMAMGARHRNGAVVMETIKGVCYATQPERIEGAVFCHDKRDFTDADDTMLQFLK